MEMVILKMQSLTFALILMMLYSGLVHGSDYESAAVVLLDRISLGEGTSDAAAQKHGLASAYEITYAYGQYNPPDSKPLTGMTIREVKQLQQQMIANGARSSAVGKYQIIAKTLNGIQTQLGLSEDTTFNAATQELFGLSLLKKRDYKEWTEGKISDNQFQRNLALEWASIAKPDTGKSAYRNNGDLAQPGDVEGSGPTNLQHVRTTTEQIRDAMAQTKSLLGISQDRLPNVPTSLSQYKQDGSSISVGGQMADRSVALKAKVSSPNGGKLILQVELRRLDEYGGQFDETKGGLKESDSVNSGEEATSYAYGLINGYYHWRARAIDESGKTSDWVDFGDSRDTADFIIYSNDNTGTVDQDTGKILTLYLLVHDGSVDGEELPGVRVTGQDGAGNRFDKTTNSNGYVFFKGSPGMWHFEASKDSYLTISWDKDITSSVSGAVWNDAFLTKDETGPNTKTEFNKGDRVRTTSDKKLNVRTNPRTDSPSIGTRVKGSTGIIIDGPVFSGNLYWWKVEYDSGITGWSSGKWLELAPQDQEIELDTNTGNVFNKGDRVRTTSEKKLNVRSGPGTSSHSIGTMVKGSMGTVMDGPIIVDNLNWWNIKYDAGITGWSSGKWLELAPQIQKGCNRDPVTGQVMCSDDASVFSQKQQPEHQVGCHRDSVTGQVIC